MIKEKDLQKEKTNLRLSIDRSILGEKNAQLFTCLKQRDVRVLVLFFVITMIDWDNHGG